MSTGSLGVISPICWPAGPLSQMQLMRGFRQTFDILSRITDIPCEAR